MSLGHGYRLRLKSFTFAPNDIRAAGVETAAWGDINGAGGFTGDNQSLLESVRRVGGGDGAY